MRELGESDVDGESDASEADSTDDASEADSTDEGLVVSSDSSHSACSKQRQEDFVQERGFYGNLLNGKCAFCGEPEVPWEDLQWFPRYRRLKKGRACESCCELDYDDLVAQADASMLRWK